MEAASWNHQRPATARRTVIGFFMKKFIGERTETEEPNSLDVCCISYLVAKETIS